MRIIAGTWRGRRIEAPPGRATRPMLDRVREALFSTLLPWLADATVLDLFAGSGSLGLEALSRGARRVRFVERGAPALAALRKNLAALGARDRIEIVAADALAPSSWTADVDVAFVDPPYALVDERRAAVLRAVERLVAGQLAAGGIAVLHVPHGALDASALAWAETRVRRYGTNDLWYLERPASG
jgi:16S rRNA (guanine966-N2)-methyltransferase